jgi:hypothetical protein
MADILFGVTVTEVKEIWKYQEGNTSSKKKHRFYGVQHSEAMCGVGIPWFSNAKWAEDKEGLDAKEKCKRCERF